MPNEFLGLELCPLFHLVCNQMLILLMFFKEGITFKRTKNLLYLIKTLQQSRKSINFWLKRSVFYFQLCHFNMGASSSAGHLILLGLSTLSSKSTVVK